MNVKIQYSIAFTFINLMIFPLFVHAQAPQNADNVTSNYSFESKSLLLSPQLIPVSEFNRLSPDAMLPTIVLPAYENNLIAGFQLKNQFRRFSLSTFTARTINWGIADIHNAGVGLRWQSTPKTSIEWNSFVSKQYSYNLNSVYVSLGTSINLNYYFSDKLQLSAWGQYLINRNRDPFIGLDYNQPKNGVGLRLEYNPNINTKYSIGISAQEDFYSPEPFIQVEGKAGFKF